jgi:hypothetical protein
MPKNLAATQAVLVVTLLSSLILAVLYGRGSLTTLNVRLDLKEDFRLQELQVSSITNDDDGRIKHRHAICSKLPRNDTSLKNVWQFMMPSILNASITPSAFAGADRDKLNSNNLELKKWLQDSIDVFDLYRLKKSMLQPPDPSAIDYILEILSRKMVDATAPPLRIMVFGGSVTAGHGCPANILNLTLEDKKKKRNIPCHLCAWPARMQDILNHALGQQGLVEVQNMGMSGSTSDVSSFVLEYNQWPENYAAEGPDIIIWDHGTNDGIAISDDRILFENLLQRFYQSTRRLRCGQKLPLVVLMDDFSGMYFRFLLTGAADNMRISSIVYRTATWYSTMAVSYANSVRDYIWGNFNVNDTVPLFGSTLTLHPGLMYHTSVAWIMVFNLLVALVDNCQTAPINNNNNNNNNNMLGTSVAGLPSKDMPLLLHDLPMRSVHQQWKDRAKESRAFCQQGHTDGSSSGCEYVWAVNQMTSTKSTADVTAHIAPVLIHTHNWAAFGTPKQAAGYVATGRGAVFEIAIPIPTQHEIRYLTIISMLSYSAAWKHSLVQMTVEVRHHDGGTHHHETTRSYEISGHHTTKTSVLVPHKFEIPTAKMRSVVRARFELVSGETFKITGMALCSF